MDKESRGLVIEILALIVIFMIVAPICADASKNYRDKRDVLLNGTDTTVDITYEGDMKKLTIYSNHDNKVNVNLVLKINKLKNSYNVYLDGNTYNLNDIESLTDGEYQYYNMGVYEVDKHKELDFKLEVMGDSYYDETITYSFMTKGLFDGSGRL